MQGGAGGQVLQNLLLALAERLVRVASVDPCRQDLTGSCCPGPAEN